MMSIQPVLQAQLPYSRKSHYLYYFGISKPILTKIGIHILNSNRKIIFLFGILNFGGFKAFFKAFNARILAPILKI